MSALDNEWPNPDFQVVDGSLIVKKWKEDFSGRRGDLQVTGINWVVLPDGRASVNFLTTNTDGLVPGELVQCNSPAPPACLQTPLRVLSVTANASFTATLEKLSGVPTTSTAFSVSIVTRGDDTGAAGGALTTLLTKNINDGASGWPYYQVGDYASLRKRFNGCVRYLVFQKKTSGLEYLYCQASSERLQQFSRQKRAFACAVIPITSGGAAKAYVVNGDGTTQYGTQATTLNVRTWIEIGATCTENPSIWREGVEFSGPANAIFVLAEFVSAWATSIPDGSYSAARGYKFVTGNTVNPWVNVEFATPSTADASGSYGFTVDVVQASRGVIGPNVTSMTGMVEGRSDLAHNQLAFKSAVVGAVLYGPILNMPVASSSVSPGDLAYAWGSIRPRNGYFVAYSISSGAQSFFTVSFDFAEFEVGGLP